MDSTPIKKRLTKSEKKAAARANKLAQIKQKSKEARPEQRQKKHQQRLKQLEGQSKEQIDEHFANLKAEKERGNTRFLEAQSDPKAPKIVIDLAFAATMSTGEKSSLTSQIALLVNMGRKCEKPFQIHICNNTDAVTQEYFERNNASKWPINFHTTGIEKFGEKFVYLSPDAESALGDFGDSTNFVIGGLIDRTIQKNASLDRSASLGVEARRLPL